MYTYMYIVGMAKEEEVDVELRMSECAREAIQ